jgi:hypothetical protein
MPAPHDLLWIEAPGGNLAASFHLPAAPRPAPAALLLHGFTGHRGEAHFLFVHTARALAAAGIAALRVDFRGSGESDGAFSDMTVETEIADADAALDWLRARPEVDPARVSVLGLSMGGAVAACLSGRDGAAGRERVAALVLWAAVAHFDGLRRRAEAEDGGPPRLPDGTVDIGGIALGSAFGQVLEALRPGEEVVGFQGPALIVHGTEDQAVALSHAEEFAGLLGERARTHIIQGADHVFSSVPWQAEAIGATRDFLLEALG